MQTHGTGNSILVFMANYNTTKISRRPRLFDCLPRCRPIRLFVCVSNVRKDNRPMRHCSIRTSQCMRADNWSLFIRTILAFLGIYIPEALTLARLFAGRRLTSRLTHQSRSFLKRGQPRHLFHLFSSFQTQITNFTTNRYVKKVHPVYDAGI